MAFKHGNVEYILNLYYSRVTPFVCRSIQTMHMYDLKKKTFNYNDAELF